MLAAVDPAIFEEATTKGYLSLNRFSQLIGVSYPTAMRMNKSGKVITIRVGGVNRVMLDEVTRYLREGNLSSEAQPQRLPLQPGQPLPAHAHDDD